MSRCMCDFPDECIGDGILACSGCGGDLCVCRACFGHGETECPGCLMCRDSWDEDDVGAGPPTGEGTP